jgi:hypothetical protein
MSNVTGRTSSRRANLKSKHLLTRANHLLDMAKLRQMIRDPNRLPLTPKMRAEATSLLLELEEEKENKKEERDKVGSLPTSADLNRGVRRLARSMRKRSRSSPTRKKRSRS